VQNRNKLRQFLELRRIFTQIYYPYPLHLQPIYRHLPYKKGDLPISEKRVREVLALPFYPGMKLKQIEVVASAMEKFFKSKRHA